MITMDTIGRVRRAFFVQKRKIKAIARELKLARNTVRDIVRAEQESEHRYVRNDQPLPQLGAHVAALETMLADNAGKVQRERLTYQRIFEELRRVGYSGGYDAVRRYARSWAQREGQRTAQAYVPLSFAPGEAYQFDWSHEVAVIDGVTTKVKVAQMRLCYSRMPFVRVYPREAQEMVFDAHEKAFVFFKGSPTRGIYDNMKTAVETVFVGKERAFNRRFEQLMNHHLIEPTACTPAAGWEKGQVENQVGVTRERFFTPRVKFKSYADLNDWLLDKCIAYAKSMPHPEQKDKTVFEMFEAERPVSDPVSRRLRRLPFHDRIGVEDLPRAVRQQQVLGDVEGGRPAGRGACVRGAHRHQAGRCGGRRACLAGSAAIRRPTIPGTMCRCWRASPGPCATARRSRTGRCPVRSRLCAAS